MTSAPDSPWGGDLESTSRTWVNRKRNAKYVTTFPRTTVTGAPQNFRQRVNKEAAHGPRPL